MSEPEAETGEEISTDNAISGSVGDGPVVGAVMRVLRNNGEEVSRLASNSSALYNITIREKGKYYPLTIDARDGTDIVTDLTPDFVLLGAVLDPGKKSVANVNPFSTFALEIARDLPGGMKKANMLTGQDIAVSALNFGLTSLVSSGPMATQIDASNVAEIIKASEGLGETVRRTRDLLVTFGHAASGDAVVQTLSSDLIDTVIDGRGGPRIDARTAAIATIVSTLVQLETMSNELHVNGVDATSKMNAAVNRVITSTPSTVIDDLTVTAEMLTSVNVGLEAAFTVSNSPKIAELQQAVFGLQAGMDHMLVRTLLPADYKTTLENELMAVAGGDASVINAINDVARISNEAPQPNSPPTISGNPPSQINANSFYDFTPTVTDLDGNALGFTGNDVFPAWASVNPNTGRLSGTPGDGDVGTYSGLTITVSDGTASDTLGPFSITVQAISLGSVTLNWTAPTQNEDGTQLLDLDGYRILWGSTPGSYPNSLTINNETVTSYVIDNLAPGTYEFVATSFNTAGVESVYSSPATKTVQ